MANLVEIKEHKEKARITPIEVFPDPKIAVVLTNQQGGATNTPLVSVGDTVAIGQKIADSKERVSAPVHSPISGKVTKIARHIQQLLCRLTQKPSGLKTTAKKPKTKP